MAAERVPREPNGGRKAGPESPFPDLSALALLYKQAPELTPSRPWLGGGPLLHNTCSLRSAELLAFTPSKHSCCMGSEASVPAPPLQTVPNFSYVSPTRFEQEQAPRLPRNWLLS